MIQRTLARLGVALTLLAAAGCGPIAAGVILALDGGGSSGNGTGGSGAQATQTSAPVGAGGGVVTLGQTAVVVPPGALSTTIQLSVALGTDVAGGEYVKVGQAIHLGPAGTTFASPVTVTLAFDPAQFPAGKTVADLIVQKRSDVGGTIVNLTPTAVDITSNRVTVQVSSFSTVQPVVLVGVASVLLISVDMALVVARRREWNVDARRWLFGAVLALGGYLLVQGMLWVELTDRIHAQRRVELATLSILLALHALHAVGGLVALGWTFWNLGQASASPRTRSTPLERLSRYARFLTGVWFVLLACLAWP